MKPNGHPVEVTGVPVTTPWVPTEPFVPRQNPHADRGHRMVEPDQCKGCKAVKPPGGWSYVCPRDARVFMGG